MMPFWIAIALLASLIQPATASEPAWKALQEGGIVAVFRHARAPGTGDPPNFELEDCATQRNLSKEGQLQAQAIGEQFKARNIRVKRVLSSRWCRSLETARLAFGQLAEAYPPLDSFFAGQGQQDQQTRNVRQLVNEWRSEGVLVLVTHQVNITALTGIFPAEGEALLLKPQAGNTFDLIGRIKF
jgi:phosphohistidine phosphatase SixA